jgi:hypothetical protein
MFKQWKDLWHKQIAEGNFSHSELQAIDPIPGQMESGACDVTVTP